MGRRFNSLGRLCVYIPPATCGKTGSSVVSGSLFKDLSAALEALPAAFVLYDADEKIVICNNSYRREYRPYEHMVQPGVSHTELQWLKVNEGLDSNAIGREKEFVREEQIRHRTGPEVEEWQDDHGRYIRLLRARLPDGNVVGMRFDITDLREAQEELKARNGDLEEARKSLSKLANLDELTGLPNRRAANARLEEIASKSAQSGENLVILQIDLDGFKQVNDDIGHDAGDSVLAEAAERLKQLVNENSMLSRIGGDEFQIAGSHTATEVVSLGNDIVKALSAPFFYKGRACHIGASVGIAVSKGAKTELEELTKQADIALYKSKRSGRGRVSVFSKDMAREQERDQQLAALLRGEGDVAHDIVLEFQPIVSVSDDAIVALEVFPSLKYPQLGTLAFEDVVTIADNTNAGARLSLQAVSGFLRWWAASDKSDNASPVHAINVSSQLLGDPAAVDAFSKFDLPPNGLLLCVSEDRLRLLDGDLLAWNIERLRDLGVKLCLEGIGGHTTLDMLQAFRPDVISLSPSVVGAIDAQTDAQDILRLVAAQSGVLGAKVLAKGLVNASQLKMLSDKGCDLVQGDLIAKQVSADDYQRFSATGRTLRRA